MNRLRSVLCILFLATLGAPSLGGQEPLTVMGFHLGMDRAAVQEIYQGFVEDQVAERVSMEKEDYRDLITVDNELSSMGNKVELAYDDDGIVTGITFQHKTVDILLDATAEDAEAFVARFCYEHGLPEMEKKDQGVIVVWSYTDEANGYKISVDNSKNLRIQRLG